LSGSLSRRRKTLIPNQGRRSPLSLLGEGTLITNCEEGKGKPPWPFLKTGYPSDIRNLPYSRRLKRERERERRCWCGYLFGARYK